MADQPGSFRRLIRNLRTRVYHRAALISDAGVSALCFKRPHPIDLRRESWTLRDDGATCPKCRAIIAARKAEETHG